MAEPNSSCDKYDLTSFPGDDVPRPAAEFLTGEEKRELAERRAAAAKDQASFTGPNQGPGVARASGQPTEAPRLWARRKRD
jgi:hypothetical protein